MTIDTIHLEFITCDTEILNSAIQGNECITQKLNISVRDNWTEFGIGPFQFSLKKLHESEDEKGWLTYFLIHKIDNRLIGSGGYTGKPTLDGTVEIGYRIAPSNRKRGLASEMTLGLVKHAFENGQVKSIVAHTLREENSATKILKKFAFVRVEEINDPDDGPILRWELKRQDASLLIQNQNKRNVLF